MHRKYAIIALSLTLAFLPSENVQADAPTCHTHSSGPYCSYHGVVQQAYVNEGNLILVYFDTPLDLSAVASVGLSASNSGACAYNIQANPDFAKLFYASVLAAQARGARVAMQLRSNVSGYLKCDRIWVEQ